MEEKTAKTRDDLTAEVTRLRARVEEFERAEARRAADEHLSEDGACLCAVFESALDGVFIIDKQGRYRSVNPAGCAMFGYTLDELIKSDISLLLFPEDAARAFEELKALTIRDGHFIPEYRMRKKDGTEIWIEFSVKPLKIGPEEFVLGIKRDVTSRRRAEAALLKEKEKARRYLDMAGAMLLVIGADERISLINRKGCEILGYPESEILGRNWFDKFLPKDRREGARSVFEKLLSGVAGSTGYVEGRVLTREGLEKTMAWNNTVLKDENGNISSVLSSGEDITGRKRAEEELLRARRALEERVRERTADILRVNNTLEEEVRKRLKAQEVLNSILLDTSSVSGGEFLRSLVMNIASTLKFRYVVVGELRGEDNGTLRSLAVWANGRFGEDFECRIAGTPCEGVVGKAMRCYEKDVTKLFPNDCMMSEWGVESYLGVPLFNSGGKPIGILVAMDDKPMVQDPDTNSVLSIFALRAALELERKRAEDALRNSAVMLDAIIDNTTAVIFMKDGAGRYILVNRWYEAVFKISRNDLAGKTDYHVFPKEMADSFRENDRKVIEENRPLEFEETVLHPDGTAHIYISLKFPVPGMQGAVCGIATDITERKRINMELRRSEERLKEAQRIAHIGNWDLDMVNNAAFWSDELYAMLGVTKGGFTPTYETFLSSAHPDDVERLKAAVFDALHNEKPFDLEYRAIRPDGAERVIHCQGRAVRNGEGKPVRFFGTAQDITGQKKMEGELLKAQKLESIGVLAGGIAHDFNNLLLGVMGNISIVKNQMRPGERLHDILNDAENAASRAKGLTRQLLTFSKGGEPIREPAPIVHLLRDTADLVLRETNVVSEFSLPDGLWEVVMDEGQIAQVINNVILNARQAMPEGGVVRIGAENVVVAAADALPLKNGDYVRITVKDEGAGIPQKLLPVIFDPFFTTKQKASGLGLAVSYSIIKKHGGLMTAESREGAGAAFHIYLPADKKAVPDRAERLITGKGRVLVMDDEELVRDVTGEMLKLLGYEAGFASNGDEAVDAFIKARAAGAPFDAAVLDLTIPGGMGGKEAVKRILEIDPGFKAIVSSGYSKDPIMSEFKDFGFSGVIAKPYRVSEFSKIVSEVISGRGGSR